MILFYLSLFLTTPASLPLDNPGLIVPGKTNKKEVIKVYPTPNNQGSITIQSANKESLNFYLFDLEGNLIYQTTIQQKETQTIDGLTKGTYIYNAFQKDENLEGGKITLK
jgi:hypothetical protein